MRRRIYRSGCLGFILAFAGLLAYWIGLIYSERTLLTLHETNDVVITIHTESYRFPDDASILWSVTRGGKSVVDGDYIEIYLDPIWPRFKALRSRKGNVIGSVDRSEPDHVGTSDRTGSAPQIKLMKRPPRKMPRFDD